MRPEKTVAYYLPQLRKAGGEPFDSEHIVPIRQHFLRDVADLLEEQQSALSSAGSRVRELEDKVTQHYRSFAGHVYVPSKEFSELHRRLRDAETRVYELEAKLGSVERKFTCPDDCSPMQRAPHDPSCKFFVATV